LNSINKPVRSLLFTPGNQLEKVRKVGDFGADVVILDLEDSVPHSEKDIARMIVKDTISIAGSGGSVVLVRINQFPSPLSEKDLNEVVMKELSGIVVPKVESKFHIAKLDSELNRIEIEKGIEMGTLTILPIIETAKGILEAYSIASASARIMAMAFGAEDLTSDMGIQRTVSGDEIAYARAQVAMSAAAMGIPAIDTVYIDYVDIDGLVREAKVARKLGFKGKLLIHQNQVLPVNQIFSPSDKELSQAKKIIRAYQETLKKGSGVTVVDGKMVDKPIVERARKLISLQKTIHERENGY